MPACPKKRTAGIVTPASSAGVPYGKRNKRSIPSYSSTTITTTTTSTTTTNSLASPPNVTLTDDADKVSWTGPVPAPGDLVLVQ
ncbi:hypothetical protein HDU76_002841, partial [Blyttiomyces sp. JEL0837]